MDMHVPLAASHCFLHLQGGVFSSQEPHADLKEGTGGTRRGSGDQRASL